MHRIGRNRKTALSKIEKLFADRLQGKKSALKNAVLKGKAGGINGFEDETSIQGLGVAPAAAIAAAVPVITSALKALVDSGAMKKSEADGLEAEVKAKTNEANSSASETDMNSTASGNDTPASTTPSKDKTSPDTAKDNSDTSKDTGGKPTDDSGGGIIGFVKKQPLVAIGGVALGIWGLSKLLGGKDKAKSSLGGVRGKNKKTTKHKKKGGNNSTKKLKSITLK